MDMEESWGFSLLNDEPIRGGTAVGVSTQEAVAEDLLGTGLVAERLAGLIMDSRRAAPFTIAVDGGWGMGKSSLMHRLDAALAGRDGVETVWFNAWTSHGRDVLEGLLKSVLGRFDRSVLRRVLNRAREHRVALRFVYAFCVAVLDVFRAGRAVDDLWRRMQDDAAARNESRRLIKQVAAQWALGSAGVHRIMVIFIDDLDRCSDETIRTVCEAVKLYLDVPGLVFVLACDEARLVRAADAREGHRAVDDAYLEKIVQISYRIPPPETAAIHALVSGYAQASGTSALFTPDLVALIAEGAGRNPRRIKRLINSFVMYQLDPAWRAFDPGAVLRIVMLHNLFADFHRAVSRPGGADLIADFAAFAAARAATQRGGEYDERIVQDLDALARRWDLPLLKGSGHSPSNYLKLLEATLPMQFPDLAADPVFVSLVRQIHALDSSGELRHRLQRLGAEAAPTPTPIDPTMPAETPPAR
jgi:hypothetical protein